jgi:hypothetical protein
MPDFPIWPATHLNGDASPFFYIRRSSAAAGNLDA